MKPRFEPPRGGLGILVESDNLRLKTPEVPRELAQERINESAEKFAAAYDEAKDKGLKLNAHGVRHFEIVDEAKSVHVFPVEQRIEGKFFALMLGFKGDWDIYDVVCRYIDARGKK